MTKAQVGLGSVTNDAQVKRSELGKAGGVATLDGQGLMPARSCRALWTTCWSTRRRSSSRPRGRAGRSM